MTHSEKHPLIWTGSYTADSGGHGAGIGAVAASSDGTLIWRGTAAKADSPSFVAAHPPCRWSTPSARASKQCRRIADGASSAWKPSAKPWPAGEAACHVAVDPRGRYLVVACWGDGQVLLYELDDDGGIDRRASQRHLLRPHDGGRPSRAHASLMLADGRIMTTDLGHDLLRVWNYFPGTGLSLDHEVVLPKDSGPRHLVQHADGTVFVVSEYSIEVFAARAASASGTVRAGRPRACDGRRGQGRRLGSGNCPVGRRAASRMSAFADPTASACWR